MGSGKVLVFGLNVGNRELLNILERMNISQRRSGSYLRLLDTKDIINVIPYCIRGYILIQ